MSPQLQALIDKIEQAENISAEEKNFLIKGINDADKAYTLAEFKLDRAEKDRHTLSVMLEETIEDLQKKTKVVEESKEALEKSLEELKATQQQLIQSEKMASLGALTAGIAHEIQNPLNFVNNFSEVSNELLDEMKAELQKGNAEDAMVMVKSIKQNLEKILHHGKRADAIVK